MRKIKPQQDEFATISGPSLKKKKSEPRYPTIRIDLSHIPEAKSWKVGETYEVDMKLKMVGISQSRYDNSAEFEIREIGPEEEDEGDKAVEDGDSE